MEHIANPYRLLLLALPVQVPAIPRETSAGTPATDGSIRAIKVEGSTLGSVGSRRVCLVRDEPFLCPSLNFFEITV